MLIRLISVISLTNFMLLMISGVSTQTAIYRSVLIFLVLFAVVYLTIFFLNVIKENPEDKKAAVSGVNKDQTTANT